MDARYYWALLVGAWAVIIAKLCLDPPRDPFTAAILLVGMAMGDFLSLCGLYIRRTYARDEYI